MEKGVKWSMRTFFLEFGNELNKLLMDFVSFRNKVKLFN